MEGSEECRVSNCYIAYLKYPVVHSRLGGHGLQPTIGALLNLRNCVCVYNVGGMSIEMYGGKSF